jgi:hypothetical protein
MHRLYNSFGSYVKRTFGATVYKVNIDAGFTCPNRDGSVGTGGCTYCNNESFKPGDCRPALSVTEQVANGTAYLKGRYGAEKFIAYFQAYTNTHAPVDTLRALYAEALAHPDVIGLAIGTRPDAVDAGKLALIAEIAEEHFMLVEYGCQSVHDKTLRAINRGHDYQCFLDAVRATRALGVNVGGHLILGFPTETEAETLDMAAEISNSGIQFLKLHQLQIVRDTLMAGEYARKPFPVYSYEDYLDFVVRFIERLSPDIVLQRLFATAPDEILIAPKWGHSRHRILRDIESAMIRSGAYQGKYHKSFSVIG